MAADVKLLFVTDPMCSWCWGMAADIERVMHRLGNRVAFDLVLGGINTHGTQPVGAYGRARILSLWESVAATTGQRFGMSLPETYVHNSTQSCVAVEAVRQATGEAPFRYLHDLQERFCLYGEDITDIELLRARAAAHGVTGQRFDDHFSAPDTLARVRFQFDVARSFGTQALPSVLVEQGGETRLLAGGYVSDDVLLEQLEELPGKRPPV